VVIRVIRGPQGTWFWHQAVGTFVITPDARRVDVYPDGGVDERILGLLLAGPLSVFLLHQLGIPTLHASAVSTAEGAVAFLGPKGQGKSSMAASFLQRDAALITDDVLPLRLLGDSIHVGPGPSIMKLWPDSASCALGLSDGLPDLMPNTTKKLLVVGDRYALAETPVRLSNLYLLDRYDPLTAGRSDISIRSLRGREAFSALLNQVSYGAFLLPSEEARFLPLYLRLLSQAPVRVLTYPQGFEHQGAVYARILSDLERR